MDRPNSDWPIARANQVFYQTIVDVEAVKELARLAELSDAWKSLLREKM